jgi:hypothetical protein
MCGKAYGAYRGPAGENLFFMTFGQLKLQKRTLQQ